MILVGFATGSGFILFKVLWIRIRIWNNDTDPDPEPCILPPCTVSGFHQPILFLYQGTPSNLANCGRLAGVHVFSLYVFFSRFFTSALITYFCDKFFISDTGMFNEARLGFSLHFVG